MPSVTRRAPARGTLAEYRRKRDFSKTVEPSGDGTPAAPRRRPALEFVIQKHAASHLHFDLRLELDGVMKSWAVPKGPSLDPSVKRLAMQVEDHPMDYNSFEGTIPQGQYGGGTVMIWDRGTYTADHAPEGDVEASLRDGYRRGDLKVRLDGQRLHGSFALVRMRGRGSPDKPQWLLIKHRDEHARPGSDVVAEANTSVVSGRTMDQIAKGRRIWQSNRAASSRAKANPASAVRASTPRATKPSAKLDDLEPMYASIGTSVPPGDDWTFEMKYDGIRVLAYATGRSAKLITRNMKDKTAQFPEVAEALQRLAARVRRPLVLDGEIVALIDGQAARFQELQSRMHVKDSEAVAHHVQATPSVFVAFDLLLDGDDVLMQEPWTERRRRLERAFRGERRVLIAESNRAKGEEMLERARREGWEGVIAKRTDAQYQPGVRSKTWLKLKIENRQEFVVGGWTEPRNTREHIGALLLGYFDRAGRFVYVGHTGGGFTREGLRDMHRRLVKLERKSSPFVEVPRTNQRAHWVRPEVVVEVKFNEWTADGKLRQPIFLGARDDKDAREVRREPESVQEKESRPSGRIVRRASGRAGASARAKNPGTGVSATTKRLVDRLSAIESSHPNGDGTLELVNGQALSVTSLNEVYFPDDGITKGDLMRYYVRVAHLILPVAADRPLVLKRFPSGIHEQSFYQQKAPEHAPRSVRVETIVSEKGEQQKRVIGGDLFTDLWTHQLGSISVDPWHSRVGSLEGADYTVLDLDPGPRAPFERVVEVAQLVKSEMDALGLSGALKTSGSTGLHVYLPLPRGVPNDAALLLAQLIATRVATGSPRAATIERSVRARPPAAVYVDYLQNIRGKTVAAAYAVRAKPGATVSTPLRWSELTTGLDPREFTISTAVKRFARVGDLWAEAMRTPNASDAILEAAGSKTASRRR